MPLVLILFLAGCSCRVSVDPAGDPQLVRTTAGGMVIGACANGDRGVVQWLGIPYAKPPVGPLRLKALRKPDPWAMQRADSNGPMCSQHRDWTPFGEAIGSEDCLYLNVIASRLSDNEVRERLSGKQPAARKALMVWVHGGGNLVESPALTQYSIGLGVEYAIIPGLLLNFGWAHSFHPTTTVGDNGIYYGNTNWSVDKERDVLCVGITYVVR